MFFKALLRRIKNEKGSIIIMTAIALPLLLGFAGLGYDVGNLYLEKGRLQNIADASALAGAAVYRDVAKDAATSGTISVDENFDNTTYYTDRPGNLSNTAHGVADSAAWDYVEKNKGAHSISVNGPFALHGAVTGQTSEGTVTTKPEDGVYYRVRLSEEIPLHFLPLIPGIGHQQTVNAEAIVAISTETGSEAHTDVQASTEYVEIFDKMFSYNSMSNSVVPNTTDSSLIYSASNQINLRHYAYMLYMNHQWSNSSADVTKTLLSSNGKPSVWHEPVQHWEQNMVWVPNMVEVEDKEYVENQVWIPNMVEVEDGYYETYYEWYDFFHLNPKQRWVKTGSHWEDHGHYEDQGYWQVTGTHMEDHGQYVDQGHYVTDQPGYWTLGTGTDDNYYSLNGYYNNNSHYTEDMYYQSKLTEKMFVNVKLESPNDVTININENLSNSYYSCDGLNYILYGSNYNEYSTNARTQTNYNSQNGWTLSGNKRFRNGYYTYSRRNNTLGSSNLKKAFPIPMYIYRESSTKSETFNDTIINVTGNSNENCYPIVLYQYNKFDPKETNVEINISDGKIFRGIIFAPDSVVKINTNNTGKFEGSILGKRVETSGTGTFSQKNFFKNENGENAEWYINYLGLNYNGDNTINYNYNSSTGTYMDTYTEQQLLDFLYQGNNSFEQQLKDRRSNVTHYNNEGEASGSDQNIRWYDSLNTRPQYAMFSQEWFEHLLVEEKARLAYFWNYYYQGDMPWLWAREADSTYSVPVAATEGLKTFRLINSRTEANPFGKSD